MPSDEPEHRFAYPTVVELPRRWAVAKSTLKKTRDELPAPKDDRAPDDEGAKA